MQNQTTIKIAIVSVTLLIVGWLLWPSGEDGSSTDQPGKVGLAKGAEQNLVSAIQPIADADALIGSDKLPEATIVALSHTPGDEDVADFERATLAIQNGDESTANQLLEKLIDRQPGLLEPYINLASSQAASGNLEQARQTLMRGLQANENYGALFNNLQKVHAALAADAYQLALAEEKAIEPKSNKRLLLPIVTALNPSVTLRDEAALESADKTEEALNSAEKTIASLQSTYKAQQESLSTAEKTIANLQSKYKTQQDSLNMAEETIANLQSKYKTQQESLEYRQQQLVTAHQELEESQTNLLSLQEKLALTEATAALNDEAVNTASDQIVGLETRLTDAQQQISKMLISHESKVALLEQELQEQKATLVQQQRLAKEQQEQQAKIIEEMANATQLSATQPAVAVVAAQQQEAALAAIEPASESELSGQSVTESESEISGESVVDESLDELAIERVKSWAKAWSEQNVESYIDHYRDGYKPVGGSISHSDWRAQRQVRLTNKKFIEVTLTDIRTQKKGDELLVNFVQRYRSNTMDDTIQKKLSLKADQGDWSQAKIVSEQVIR